MTQLKRNWYRLLKERERGSNIVCSYWCFFLMLGLNFTVEFYVLCIMGHFTQSKGFVINLVFNNLYTNCFCFQKNHKISEFSTLPLVSILPLIHSKLSKFNAFSMINIWRKNCFIFFSLSTSVIRKPNQFLFKSSESLKCIFCTPSCSQMFDRYLVAFLNPSNHAIKNFMYIAASPRNFGTMYPNYDLFQPFHLPIFTLALQILFICLCVCFPGAASLIFSNVIFQWILYH